MSFELGRALYLSDAAGQDALAGALHFAATHGIALPRALLATGAIDPERLETELARAEAPVLRHVVPLPVLVHQLPAGLCERLLAVPLRRDARTGTVDIAVVDVRDGHAAEEIAYWLSAPVRVLRASYAAMDAALKRMKAAPDRGMSSLAPPIWVPSDRAPRQIVQTPLYGTPAVRMPAPEGNSPAPIVPPAALDMPIPLTAVRRTVVPDGDPPPVVRERTDAAYGPVTRMESKEFPTLEETLPEPVLELRNVKPSSRRLEESPPSRAPNTARGPFAESLPGLPYPDATAVLAAMRTADGRDAVLELFMAGLRAVARKIALFAVKRDALVGLRCTPDFGDLAALRQVQIPLAAPSILVQALGSPGAQLGRVLKIEAHEPLLGAMASLPTEVAVIAVRIGGKPALSVLLDELGDTMLATRRMEELAQGAGDALGRLLRHKRKD